MLPSFVLLFEKSVRDSTIKSTVPILDDLNLLEEDTYIEVPTGAYISNGWIQESYQTPFIPDNDSSIDRDILETEEVDVVGNKFVKNSLQALSNFSTSFESGDTININLNSRHSYFNNNPMLQNPLLFGITQEDLSAMNMPENIVDYKCILDDILSHREQIPGQISSLMRNKDFSDQILSSIPMWKISVRETHGEEPKDIFTLQTAGFSFNSAAGFMPFYQNIEVEKINTNNTTRFDTLLGILKTNNRNLDFNSVFEQDFFKQRLRNVYINNINFRVFRYIEKFI